jgi:hypothetical protein
MNELIRAVLDFLSSLRPWVTVLPWEGGVRVRAGKHSTPLTPGVHWRIPFLDKLFVLPIRRHFVNLPLLDVMTKAGHPVTVGLTVGFQITSVEELLHSVSQPEDAISDLVQMFASRHLRGATEFNAGELEAAAAEGLGRSIPGIGEISITVTSFSNGRRVRLIMDQRWTAWGGTMTTTER